MEALLESYVGDELRSNGEAGLLTRESWDALHREIGGLTPEDRRLVELRYWDRRTWEEVGAALGVADRTARERDLRIRERLARR